MLKKITQSFLALLLMMVIGVVSASAKTEKVHATFESPSNTNTTWNSETRTFTWSTTYYNQLRNIGLPSGGGLFHQVWREVPYSVLQGWL